MSSFDDFLSEELARPLPFQSLNIPVLMNMIEGRHSDAAGADADSEPASASDSDSAATVTRQVP